MVVEEVSISLTSNAIGIICMLSLQIFAMIEEKRLTLQREKRRRKSC